VQRESVVGQVEKWGETGRARRGCATEDTTDHAVTVLARACV